MKLFFFVLLFAFSFKNALTIVFIINSNIGVMKNFSLPENKK
jgi:hypothetical protein